MDDGITLAEVADRPQVLFITATPQGGHLGGVRLSRADSKVVVEGVEMDAALRSSSAASGSRSSRDGAVDRPHWIRCHWSIRGCRARSASPARGRAGDQAASAMESTILSTAHLTDVEPDLSDYVRVLEELPRSAR